MNIQKEQLLKKKTQKNPFRLTAQALFSTTNVFSLDQPHKAAYPNYGWPWSPMLMPNSGIAEMVAGWQVLKQILQRDTVNDINIVCINFKTLFWPHFHSC